MFAAFKGKCVHCGHDHDEDAPTPAPAPAGKPFMYAIADIEGRAVLDEVCVAEHPSELELSEEDEGRGWKIVPVYTGPQIEAMREALSKKAPAPAPADDANKWRSYAAQVVAQRDRMRAALEAYESARGAGPAHVCTCFRLGANGVDVCIDCCKERTPPPTGKAREV